MQVIRWEDAFIGGEPTNIFTENLEDVRFLNDREAYTIARALSGLTFHCLLQSTI